MSDARLADGRQLTLGAVLAKAGEGTIYAIDGDPTLVAKVYHADRKDLTDKSAKLAAMISAPPVGITQSDGFTVLTWPQQLLTTDDGRSGYVMAKVDTANAVEIHSLSNPVNRADPLPTAPQWTRHATWGHLVNVAANLCLAVDAVHSVSAVIGDFQERNILVNDTTRVTLVDCDSMQFIDADGHRYLCPVGRPEFTAPELVGTDLSTTPRHPSSDLFALAVHIHLLLMAGNHPFLRGAWTGPGEQPDALTLAKSGEWAGGPGSRLHTHPLAPPPAYLPTAVQALFVRAFTDGARTPQSRPTAAEWRAALQTITVVTCPGGHQLPEGNAVCPWCAIDAERARRKQERAAAAAVPSPPPQRPYPVVTAVPPQPKRSSSRVGLMVGGGVFLIVAVVLGYQALSPDSQTPARSQSTYAPSTYSTATRTVDSTVTVTEQAPSTYRRTPNPATASATIVGTCDEGGTCGVKQRTAPVVSAPRLVSTDLRDGDTVTLVCQAIGDTRTSDGHGSSTTWYRLGNGAYVNSVYFDVTPGLPSC